MTALSFERLLTSRLAVAAPARDAFIADRSIRLTRSDQEQFEGKVQKSKGDGAGGGRAQGLAQKLSQRVKRKPAKLGNAGAAKGVPYFDTRQRVIAKIHYFNHAGAGGGALKAHGKYIARDAAHDDGRDQPANETGNDNREHQLQSHANYLERSGKNVVFYDRAGSGFDGANRLEAWAKSDLRHFRIVLSAENGAQLRDLPAFTREVMARAGAALGSELNWVAVDHHDTDNPHTHIVLRGRRANGQDLVLPRDFIRHEFRSIARDVATEWLGRRTIEQERLAYARDIRRHAPTRLDAIIERNARDGAVNLRNLEAPNGDRAATQAAKARVQELARMGLAEARERGLFHLAPDWRNRLKAMERHLDIRKRLMHERAARSIEQHRGVNRHLGKGMMDR